MKVIRKWRRRRPGIYAWRTDRHHDRTRREWGYVGESVNVPMRDRCHMGTCGHQAKTTRTPVPGGMLTWVDTRPGCSAKPWTDLRPVRYTIIPLPWWLGWKWILRPLETLAILALAPRYNHSKSQWNPRRIPLSRQAAQRHERDCESSTRRAEVATRRIVSRGIQALGIALILVGLAGALITR